MANEATRLVRFGDGANAYTFPDVQSNLGWNFGDIVPRITKLHGVSGGYDEYGSGIAPTEIGNVRTTFTVQANSRGEMHAKRDAIMKMVDMGTQRLWLKPGDLALRWCNARVNAPTINIDPSGFSDLHQSVTMQFQVADPFWYTQGSGAIWGESEWGDAEWGGVTPIVCTTTSTTDTLSVSGTTMTQPQIIIVPASGGACISPAIERLVDGVVVDRVTRLLGFGHPNILTIDARALSVTYNGANSYASNFSYLHPSWMRLFPGNNTIRVTFASITGTVNVQVKWFNKYR